ncbi:hypothetical protein CASFOL_002327 [Castilleja foliolosa]|uniref:Peroxidase n=1 Tax=Castilleja foliolosa TaxID=1961234 RepID=A0ABD3EHG7_9LAMI
MGEFSKFEVVLFLFLGLVTSTHADHGLRMDYYNKTCPNATNIVHDYIINHLPSGTPTAAASLLRLFFHDCFVEGCDGSVLLDSTHSPESNKTEKTSPINLSLKGFDIINSVKSKLEKECPGVVSCADTLALATRAAIFAIGGPHWEVPCGRKDGTKSNDKDPLKFLPFPTDNITTLERKFKDKGLNSADLVLLSAAHTIGRAACTSCTNRLYNFTGKGDQDPGLNRTYAIELKHKCPKINSTFKITMDPGSEKNKFDLSYYENVIQHKGLFGSDAALVTDPKTKSVIEQLLADVSGETFKQRFAEAMVKMGNIEVKTGSAGQVRKNCAFVN